MIQMEVHKYGLHIEIGKMKCTVKLAISTPKTPKTNLIRSSLKLKNMYLA